MAASELDTSFIFEAPANIANQHVISLPMTCFARLDSLMGEGKGPDWTEHIRRGSPTTGRGYSGWDRLTYVQRHVKNAPQAPDLARQTMYVLYKDSNFRIAVKGASRVVDKVCHGLNGGKGAMILEGETRRYLIPACVAIIKAVFERAEGPEEELGSFTKVTLEMILRALDWIYKLKEVVGGGDAWKGRLGEALQPLAGTVLAAMRDIRDIEVGHGEDNKERSRDTRENVEEERSRREISDGDDSLEKVESKEEESDREESDAEGSNHQESNDRDKGVEEEGSNEEDESTDEAEHMKEEDLEDAYSQLGYEPGLDSDSDYSATTAQATGSKRRRTRRQTAHFSSKSEDEVTAVKETETRANLKRRGNDAEYDSLPRPKRSCRRDSSSHTQTESEEPLGARTRSREGQSTWTKKAMALPLREKPPRRSARIKKLQKPKKDGGKLGIPHWVEAPLYMTVYNGKGIGERVPVSDRRGFLVRDGLGFFASKEERLRQGWRDR